MTPLFVDSSVVLLAVGGDHSLRQPCRAVLEAAHRGEVVLHMSVEGGQEFLFHRVRRRGVAAAVAEFELLDVIVRWHDFDAEILRRSVALVRDAGVRGRDAVHAATAIEAGFGAIVSCDEDFDAVPGLVRVAPEDVTRPS